MSILDLQGMTPERSSAHGPLAVPSNLSLLLCDGNASSLSIQACTDE